MAAGTGRGRSRLPAEQGAGWGSPNGAPGEWAGAPGPARRRAPWKQPLPGEAWGAAREPSVRSAGGPPRAAVASSAAVCRAFWKKARGMHDHLRGRPGQHPVLNSLRLQPVSPFPGPRGRRAAPHQDPSRDGEARGPGSLSASARRCGGEPGRCPQESLYPRTGHQMPLPWERLLQTFWRYKPVGNACIPPALPRPGRGPEWRPRRLGRRQEGPDGHPAGGPQATFRLSRGVPSLPPAPPLCH